MSDLIGGVAAFFTLIWTLVSAIFGVVWWLLETYPKLRVVVIVAAVVLFIYWFADGVKNWRKKCIPCRGKGSFDSKISTKLNRPCDCCADDPGGAGRHPTIRSRMWNRIKH